MPPEVRVIGRGHRGGNLRPIEEKAKIVKSPTVALTNRRAFCHVGGFPVWMAPTMARVFSVSVNELSGETEKETRWREADRQDARLLEQASNPEQWQKHERCGH
jgi:hypothetical protein